MTGPADPWTIATQLGLPGMLVLAFWLALSKQVIVLGRELIAEQREREKSEARERYWMELALSGTELARTSLDLNRAEQRRLP